MKNSFLLFAFIAFSLLSCSNSDNETNTIEQKQLIATWLLDNAKLDGKEVGSSFKIEFNTENRAKYYYHNKTSNTTYGPDIIENGDFTTKNSNLTINWDSSDPGNETTQYEILELTTSKLILKSMIPGEGTLVETYIR